MLNPTQQRIKNLLRSANFDSIWGAAIEKALQEDDDERIKLLIEQLADNAKDNPFVMINVLGFDILEELRLNAFTGLHSWFELFTFLNNKGHFKELGDIKIVNPKGCSASEKAASKYPKFSEPDEWTLNKNYIKARAFEEIFYRLPTKQEISAALVLSNPSAIPNHWEKFRNFINSLPVKP